MMRTPVLKMSPSTVDLHNNTAMWGRQFPTTPECGENNSPRQPPPRTVTAEPLTHRERNQSVTKQAIHTFVHANLRTGVSLKRLSEFLGYCEKYSSEFFQAVMGESFSSYHKQLKLREARQLLSHTDTTVAQIAERLGYSDQFAFSHFFKNTIGRSPQQFREQVRRPITHSGSARHRPVIMEPGVTLLHAETLSLQTDAGARFRRRR
jgi:AraC-like DNA-binding protein